ncbi:dihydrofolate reductase [Paremcibacter congregatus]|uniref:Dihydrofolate reductase n=1 Tax=Paremcibacter congregatus TaxID=2043170 RepID=A0A2G4YU26_9PROT|nr:dihydrofolate reductase [Paremcibacter congregatus]PHZ84956.1 dihydrofolate reductase [Paremcibacter congregatus]QDE26070.1 dihydrofolate reductase [Paremcibacter congregatus]
MVKLSMIVAVAENGVIGKDNDLPWKISSDMKYFKETTMGKPVIMGRKTFQSIGRPLPGRTNIVITRDTGFAPEGVIPAFTLEMALEVGKSLAEAKGLDEVMVIGGAEIYKLCLPDADRLYLTRVHGDVEGDATFPELDPEDWLESNSTRHKAGEKDSHDYSLIVLDRV